MATGPQVLQKPHQVQGTLLQACPVGVAAPQPRPRCRLVPEAPELAALAARRRCGETHPRWSLSFNPPPSGAPATSGRGRAVQRQRRASWSPGEFFHHHRRWAPGRTASVQPTEEAQEEMPLSPPSQGDSREASPSKAPKKHPTFHLWRSKKKQSPMSSCGVFVPHPPAAFGETR